MSDPILAQRNGAVGRIRLNRPERLNALSLEGIEAIAGALAGFVADPAVALVLIDHIGDKGFCAGGDAVGLAKSGRDDGSWARTYLARQYALDAAIHGCSKPVVTIADGAVLGGGLGLLLSAGRRVVTDRTSIAFMEAMVGMVPDVGASWVLPRLLGRTGWWLALTGAKVRGADAVRRGLADRCVAPADVPGLVEALIADPASLDRIVPAGAGQADAVVDQYFAGATLAEVRAALEAGATGGDEWATAQQAAIGRMSPTASAATMALLEAGAGAATFRDALDLELAVNADLVCGHDFLAFARANLLERDQPAEWSPTWAAGEPTYTIPAAPV